MNRTMLELKFDNIKHKEALLERMNRTMLELKLSTCKQAEIICVLYESNHVGIEIGA